MQIQEQYFDRTPITLNTKFDDWYKKEKNSKTKNFVLIQQIYFIEGCCELKYYPECKSLQIYSFDLLKQFQHRDILTNFAKNILKNKNYDIDYIVVFDVHYKELPKFLKNGWSTKCYNQLTHNEIYQSMFMQNKNYIFSDDLNKCACASPFPTVINEEEEIEPDEDFIFYRKERKDFLHLQQDEVIFLQIFFFIVFLFVCFLKFYC